MQLVYTISKFKEAQDEFAGKVYCDLISSLEGPFGTTYEVREMLCMRAEERKKIFLSHLRKIVMKLYATFICSNFGE